MLHTLYAKLAVVLLALFVLIAVFFIAIARFALGQYQQELTQQMNRDLAAHVIAERPLLKDRQINQQALGQVFESMMIINPTIEIYLLDTEGEVLGFFAPHGKVKRERVDMKPINAFLGGGAALPILGEDPRDLKRNKVFSVAQIRGPSPGQPQGYLYIILGGEEYANLAQQLESSYILKLSLWAMAASLLFALLAGLVLFAYLTRRLRLLSAAMDAFKEGDELAPARYPERPTAHDEIDRLGQAFRAMAQRIIAQIRDLKQTDQLRRELVANVSHDLRTPLTSLQGYLDTLSHKGMALNSDERQRYLETAAHHSRRLGRLVSELFELAKLDACVTSPHPEPFSLAELAQDTIQKFELEARRKNIAIDANFNGSLPFVRGDINLIERLFVNLMDNALRYTDQGGTIRLQLQPNDSTMTVQVSDSGCGIPPEEIPYVFDRFHRASQSPAGVKDGAGLGLAIARRIVELHGGHISVDSAVNEGTTFRFDLPLHVPAV